MSDAAWADNTLGETKTSSTNADQQSWTLQHEVNAYLLELSPAGSTIIGYWQMLKFSFKHGCSPNFTIGLLISEEIATLEGSSLACTLVPKDLGLACSNAEHSTEDSSSSDIGGNSDTD
ncbi:hypothetical protein CVT24_009826 [Panaeolus cyanescens]|uniref:Uncharacterized protein n=1 Tax=Panaeolus cyanescens TaxID=181874 RepID=A0A409X7J7_9AGAR|nr:hypothetical protein CVT24_009826 [Panaeolus cyanescens]